MFIMSVWIRAEPGFEEWVKYQGENITPKIQHYFRLTFIEIHCSIFVIRP